MDIKLAQHSNCCSKKYGFYICKSLNPLKIQYFCAVSFSAALAIKTTDFERNWWFFLNFLLLFKKVKFEIVRYQVFSKHGAHECSNSYSVFVKRFLHNKSRKGGLLDRPSFQKKKPIRNVLQRKHKTCVLTLREHCVQFGNNIRKTPQQV